MVKILEIKAPEFLDLKTLLKDKPLYQVNGNADLSDSYRCDCDQWDGGEPTCDCNR